MINGSIDATAKALTRLSGQVETLVGEARAAEEARSRLVPVVDELVHNAQTAVAVAAAIRKKELDERSRWERWQGKVGWGLGIVAVTFTIASSLQSLGAF